MFHMDDSKTRKSLVSQLVHVASCDWWKGVPTWTHHHPSTNHNLSHRQVVSQVVAVDLFPKLFFLALARRTEVT